MDTDIQMVQGDAAPSRIFNFVRQDGTIGDLTNATNVDFLIIRPDTQAQTNVGFTSCTILNPKTAGQAQYSWRVTDLPVAGLYRSLLRITYNDGSLETNVVRIEVESITT